MTTTFTKRTSPAPARTATARFAACGFIIILVLIILILPGCTGKQGGGTGRIKIGFLVKQPDEPWFQNEWKFAQVCADSFGFDIIKIGATDGEKVLAAIDNLAAQGAKGFVICAPDVRLGPSIVARAHAQGLKVMSVDDRFVSADGSFIADVPHLGISATEIGRTVGRALADEMRKRGWDPKETSLCAATWEELQTTRERTDGAIAALVESGFPKESVFKAPQRVADIPGAFDAVNALLVQHAGVKRWLVCGNNDNAVLGAVRALEGRGYDASNVIAIGINGTDCIVEFRKERPTGFFASILLAPKRHGFDTAEMMYRWVTGGVEPPKETYTQGILITRDTFAKVLAEQGLQ
jgi:L-arabinose transport system substrate-binding protein